VKNYLSFGGGVNSVALYLLMKDLGMDFEALFVNHGGDWPETYQYTDYFIGTGRPVTVLKPSVRSRSGEVFDNIVEYFEHLSVLPSKNPKRKYCTQKFKSYVLDQHQETPCFVHIGYAADEAHRAKISSNGGREYRWLLVEHGIDRQGCIDLIKRHGLKVPPKSGCYICPYQGVSEYRKLRKEHPDLFCRAHKLEEAQNARVTRDGRPWKPYYLAGNRPLNLIIDERQAVLPGLEELEYPPCQCGL
jgi:hypothetical protein